MSRCRLGEEYGMMIDSQRDELLDDHLGVMRLRMVTDTVSNTTTRFDVGDAPSGRDRLPRS